MFGIIYTNENGDLLAKKFAKQNEYIEFVRSIKEEYKLYFNDTVIEENIKPEKKEDFMIFLKSLKKQWGGTSYVHIPHKIESIDQGNGEVIIEVTPKKPRKKRQKKTNTEM